MQVLPGRHRPTVTFRARPGPGAVRWAAFAAAGAVLAAGLGWGVWWRMGPTILAAFAVFERWSGGLDRRAATRRAVILALAAAGVYCVHRPPGWTMTGLRLGMLAAGTFLAAAVADSLPDGLRSALARRPDGRSAHAVALVGVAGPMTAFCLAVPKDGPPGDTLPAIATAARMLARGDRDLSAYLPPCPLPGWSDLSGDPPYNLRRGPDGRVYSAYPAGVEVFAVPAVLVAAAVGADLDDGGWHARAQSAAAAVVAGLTLGLIFLTALRIGPPPAAAAVTALAGVGSALTTTAGQWLWQQTGVAFWIAVALYAEFRTGGWPGRAWAAVQGVACGMMFACRPSAATFLVPFGLWVLARDWRRGLLVPVLAAAVYLPFAWVYWSETGQPLGPSAGFLASGYQSAALAGREPDWAVGAHLAGVLFSPGRGLFVYQPWAVLALFAVLPATAGSGPTPPGWKKLAAAFIAGHLLLIGSWGMWWGGWCYGSRLATELVPVLALLAVGPCARLLGRAWGWLPVLLLGALGFGIHAAAGYAETRAWNAVPASVDFAPGRLWDWADAPFLRCG